MSATEMGSAEPEDSFVCSSCGMSHPGLPFSFAADFPDRYANLSRDERDTRASIGSDQCVIDEEEFYIRGCLEIPVLGCEDPFMWGVWARVKVEVYDEISANWQVAGREKSTGPYKGRLANVLSVYTETLNVRVKIKISEVGVRPLFLVEDESDIGEEQRFGITQKQASEKACLLMRMYQP
jgi:hypothetical protein